MCWESEALKLKHRMTILIIVVNEDETIQLKPLNVIRLSHITISQAFLL